MPDETKSCAVCRFFKAAGPGDGKCLRKTPELMPDGMGAWPLVKATDWCGAFGAIRATKPAQEARRGAGRPRLSRAPVIEAIRAVADNPKSAIPFRVVMERVLERMPVSKSRLHDMLDELVDAGAISRTEDWKYWVDLKTQGRGMTAMAEELA